MGRSEPARTVIFVAEDNLGDLTLLREAFAEAGVAADLEIARDGEEALSLLSDPERDAPHLIILNFNLPKRLGCEVLAGIKEDPRLQRVPVVILTTSSEARDRQRCEQADAYYVKARDWEEMLALAERLRRWLPRTSRSGHQPSL